MQAAYMGAGLLVDGTPFTGGKVVWARGSSLATASGEGWRAA
jgi:hypothetical protein